MPTRARRAALLAAAAALLAAGCGEGDEGDEENVPGPRLEVVVGNSLPLSGGLEDFGSAGEKSAHLAAERIEAAVAALGGNQSLELASVDNGGGGELEQAVASARRLIEDDGSDCLVGPWATSDVLAVARQVAIPERIPLVSPSAPGDEISALADRGLISRVVPPDARQGPALASAIARELGEGSQPIANVGARDDAYGNALADSFIRAWEELGGQIGAEVRYDPRALSLARPARELVAGEPDATVIFEFPETYARLARELSATGDYEPGSAWASDGLAAGLPEDLPAAATEGLRGTVIGTPAGDESTLAFFDLLGDAEPRDVRPATYDAHVFDAVTLCFLAAYAAESDDGAAIADQLRRVSAPPGEAYSWQELPQAMRALAAGRDIDYQGASGGVDLDSAGDPTSGVYDIYRHEGGKLRLIGEVPLARETASG